MLLIGIDVKEDPREGKDLKRTKRTYFLVAAVAALALLGGRARAQVIGSYDNFDCFNDTGETAEGFEIDVEDIAPSDLTREFPSNFSSTPWVIRYGLPTVTSYDWTAATPDAAHAFDAGHKGVLITWAAAYQGGKWVAQYGSQPFTTASGTVTTAGNGTPYVKNPTYTTGDSCWYYGLGQAYPTSGCDHFGISFGAGVVPGKMSYHWKVPDPNNIASLINGAAEASIPPSPSLAPLPAQPAVIHAAAEAPENPDPQWGPAYWAKITTLYRQRDARLDALQKANIKKLTTPKVVTWSLLQRPPAGDAEAVEKEDVEDDAIPANYVQVTKMYEYFAFHGAYDSGTHEAVCDTVYPTQADLLAKTNPLGNSCENSAGNVAPFSGSYWVADPETGAPVFIKNGSKGKYVGAHINAYNVQ